MAKVLPRTIQLAALAAASAAGTVAYAQSSDGAQRGTIDEIVVTARKREESIQDVPLAVTAFDSEQLKRRSITELEDVARFTAGFAFEDFDGGNANPVIRGQSTLRATAREQTVATFLDGVYMPRSWLVDQGTNNMERIEIVKGPQSSRYGRNAFAGAINYVPKKADGPSSIEGTVTLGNEERVEVGVGGTLRFSDTFAVRAAYDTSEFDGTWDNNHPNAGLDLSPGTEGKIGGWDSDQWSINAIFEPIESLSFDLAYYGFDRSEEARAARWLNTRTGIGNCGSVQPTDGGGTGGSLFCGEYPVPASEATVDPRGHGRQSEGDIFKFAVSYDINDAFEVSYLYGLVDAETIAANTAEADTVNCGTILGPPVFPALCNFQGSPSGAVDYEQHELRLSFANDGPWTFTVGGFVMDGTDEPFSVSANVAPLGTTGLSIQDMSFGGFTNFVFRDELSDTKVQSIFGEVIYELANGQTRISAEARQTSEEITTWNQRFGTFVGSEDFDFFTPRVTIEHDLTDDNLVFFTAARGAKAGGFNANAITPAFLTYEPEFNWTYEFGSKNVLMNGTLVLNSALYLTQWEDQQISTLDPAGSPFTGALTSNLGDATIWGFEVEGAFDLNENLSFDGAFSYTDATYDSGTIDELIARSGFGPFPNPCDDIVCSSTGDVGGNDLERSPGTQISLGVQWAAAVNEQMDYYVRGDIGYQSSFYADAINAAEAPDRTVMNASGGINFGNYEVSLWVRNLTDEEYVSNSLQIIQNFSNNILGTYFGERRTFGLTVSASFE